MSQERRIIMLTGYEWDICKKILSGKKMTYGIKKSAIGYIFFGGTIDCPRFCVDYYEKTKWDDLLIVEAVKDEDSYYFRPKFSDDKILIYSEDYYVKDVLSAPLGEIKTSRNRDRASKRDPYSSFYDNLDPNYVMNYEELVTKNPLAINLASLIELEEIENLEIVMAYNKENASELSRELKRMKLDASRDLITYYRELHQRMDKKNKLNH